ncbi:MAG: BTAD domain-containing putative transcriptional regulator [Kibdelosporangium sp.]
MGIDLVLLPRVAYRGQEINGPRLRGLFALLAGELRTGCSAARLMAGLWPAEQPENPGKALQILVSRARSRLGSDLIVSTPAGYRLALKEEQVDTAVVVRSALASAQRAQAGDHTGALEQAEAGLALWEGTTNDTGLDDPVAMLRAERESTHWALVRVRGLALSRLERRAEALETLTGLIVRFGRDEEVLLELLRCEAATVGPSVALDRYDAYRRALRDESGSDPGAALQTLYQELLRGAAPLIRHGVPHEPNPLLGRDEDIAAVAKLLRTSRVTSIVGPGGLGKTRLAHVVSHDAEQRSVYLVALAGAATDDDVLGEVVSALGVGETGPASPRRQASVLANVVAALGPGPALLVLDNCEHVVRGAAELVRKLTSMSKDLRVLTTSRAPLGISSESVYLLPELDLPTTVELFGQRARAARPGVELPADTVEELCDRLDGLPLAVELAAARVRVLSVAEIARRLEDRFSLLRGGARDAPQRHQTLHAVIDWSWNLVDREGQRAMRGLSIFPGGFTMDAAGHMQDSDILPVLEHLVDQSLLKTHDTPAGVRFRMLETVREFSAARREAAGETDDAVGRFLAWARDFGLRHHDSLFGADLFASAEQIRAEQDNLTLALRHALDRADSPTVAAVSATLGSLWTVESNFGRTAALAGETAWIMSHARPDQHYLEAARTTAVLSAVNTFIMQGIRAARCLVTLRRLPPAPPDTMIRAMDLVMRMVFDHDGRSALMLACDSDERLLSGVANAGASYLWENETDVDSALHAATRMLAALDHDTTPWMRIVAHARICELCLQLGRGAEARTHMLATRPMLERLGPASGLVRMYGAAVLANLQIGDVDEAERWLDQTVPPGADDVIAMLVLEKGARAEIMLARGQTEAGLRQWRQVAIRLRTSDQLWWSTVAQVVAVVAHAQHGRLGLVTEIAAELPAKLAEMTSSASPAEFPLCGGLLLAVAMVDIDQGQRARGARLIALAEYLRFVREFQPTMSGKRAREAAEQADRAAYADAVSSYADLRGADLLAAVSTILSARG